MNGGEKGLFKGDRVKLDDGKSAVKEGKILLSQGNAGDPTDTLFYKVQWDDGTSSGWIPQYDIVSLSVNPPEPSGQGRRRKTRRKRSKRKKTYRR